MIGHNILTTVFLLIMQHRIHPNLSARIWQWLDDIRSGILTCCYMAKPKTYSQFQNLLLMWLEDYTKCIVLYETICRRLLIMLRRGIINRWHFGLSTQVTVCVYIMQLTRWENVPSGSSSIPTSVLLNKN